MRSIHTSQCLLLGLALLLLPLLATLLTPVLARLVVGSLAVALAEGCGLVVLDALVVFLAGSTTFLAPLLASVLGVLASLGGDRLRLGSGLVPLLRLGLLNLSNRQVDFRENGSGLLLLVLPVVLVVVPATTLVDDVAGAWEMVVV